MNIKERKIDIAKCWVTGLCVILLMWGISSTFEVWYAHYLWDTKEMIHTYSNLNIYELIISLCDIIHG